MSGGGGGAPKPDKNIGIAARESAEIGRDYMNWMKDQSEISNAWAAEDRARYNNTFLPMQDAYIRSARKGPDYSKVDARARQAGADVRRQFALAQGQEERRLASMGVNPASGRSKGATRRSEIAEALGVSGAQTSTRLSETARAEAEAEAKTANAINMGSGLAVNPATSLGLANNSMTSGANAAMRGLGQQGQLLSQDHQNRMSTWQANQQQSNSMWGGIGSIAGFALSNPGSVSSLLALSSKDYKEDGREARGVLDTVRKMPVEEWKYKDGIADGGQHVGPYAEDFHAATGKGDGKTIPVVDMMGVQLGAIQELDRKIAKMSRGVTSKGGAPAGDPSDRRGAGPTPKSIMGAA